MGPMTNVYKSMKESLRERKKEIESGGRVKATCVLVICDPLAICIHVVQLGHNCQNCCDMLYNVCMNITSLVQL